MSTAHDLKKLKFVNQRVKDIVFGFIHESQALIPSYHNNPYFVIPTLVELLCLSYYYEREYFSVFGDNMEINETRDTIFKSGETIDCTAYGNIVIDDSYAATYKWKFKVIHCMSDIIIGIDSSNKQCTNLDFSEIDENDSHFYSFGSSMYLFSHSNLYDGDGYGIIEPDTNGSISWKQSDIIEMEVNVKTQKMRVFINGTDQGIAYHSIPFGNVKYHMAVYMYGEKDKLQLLSFDTSFVS